MGPVFRAIQGQVLQDISTADLSVERSTGASYERGELIKLKYIKFEFDESAIGSGFGDGNYLKAVMEIPASGFEFKRVRVGAYGPMEYEWFVPDDFPTWVADSLIFTVSSPVEAEQAFFYFVIYEIVKETDLNILQANKNYLMYG